MTRAHRAHLLFITALAACTNSTLSESAERTEFADEGFSCVVPDGWTVSRDDGATILTRADQPRRTIAIRSVALSPSYTEQRLVRDTEQVLRALPTASLRPPRAAEATMPAREYRLTFQPPNQSTPYARRHILVTGRRHAFHVIETSPAPALDDDLILELVASLREES